MSLLSHLCLLKIFAHALWLFVFIPFAKSTTNSPIHGLLHQGCISDWDFWLLIWWIINKFIKMFGDNINGSVSQFVFIGHPGLCQVKWSSFFALNPVKPVSMWQNWLQGKCVGGQKMKILRAIVESSWRPSPLFCMFCNMVQLPFDYWMSKIFYDCPFLWYPLWAPFNHFEIYDIIGAFSSRSNFLVPLHLWNQPS